MGSGPYNAGRSLNFLLFFILMSFLRVIFCKSAISYYSGVLGFFCPMLLYSMLLWVTLVNVHQSGDFKVINQLR